MIETGNGNKVVLVDISYLFHRHLYRLKDYEKKNEGRVMLSYEVSDDTLLKIFGAEEAKWRNHTIETGRMYFAIKDLESISAAEKDAWVIVCMDSKSDRKDENAEYKSNRSKLEEIDKIAYDNMQLAIENAGYTVVKVKGMEADDIIAALVDELHKVGRETTIYTPDSDLVTKVQAGTDVMRYKSVYSKYGNNGKHLEFMDAHKRITVSNYEEVLSAEFKCPVPYNSLMLYKCTVGDKSDRISGIKGFGPAAFAKYVEWIKDTKKFAFSLMREPEYLQNVLDESVDYFGKGFSEQALKSLELVGFRRNFSLDEALANIVEKYPSDESKIASYKQFGIIKWR